MINQIEEVLEYLSEKKCKDISAYDLSKEEQSYDYIILMTVSSPTNNKKIANILMKDFGLEMYPEGYNRGEWIIFDLGELVIHSFIPQAREKYNLDRLWQSKKISFKKD